MKIKTQKDVEKLDLKIQEELGVHVHKYKNEEVVESFVQLLVFPEYVFNWVIRPILISLALYIIGFWVVNLVHIEYAIYALLGFVLFLVTGVLIGLLFLMRKMKTDIWGIVDYSLSIMKSALTDMNLVNNQLTKENRSKKLELLFKGIIHVVTIPMIAKVVSEKVPFFVGGFINSLLRRVLILISDKVKFNNSTTSKKESNENLIATYSSSITTVSTGLEKVVGLTFKVAQFPLKIVFVIVMSLLLLFLYVIN